MATTTEGALMTEVEVGQVNSDETGGATATVSTAHFINAAAPTVTAAAPVTRTARYSAVAISSSGTTPEGTAVTGTQG
jgi:hypothetical protein